MQVYLDENNVTGTIPSEFGNMQSLGSCRHSNHRYVLFSAMLSSNFVPVCSIIINIENMVLGDNNLNGTLSTELMRLPRLSESARLHFAS